MAARKDIADVVYPERAFGGFTRIDGTVAFCSRIQALLKDDDVVVDVGCGRGGDPNAPIDYRRRLKDLRGAQRHVIGIDVDTAGEQNPIVDEFRLIEDTTRWPIDDASVDVLHADMVMEHVDDPAGFIAEAWRVLKPGGHFALRTPNRWSYISLIAQIIPNRHHAKVATYAQRGEREEEDVFPTLYRCNTRSALTRALRRQGFECYVFSHVSEPSYLVFSRTAYRLGAIVHRALPPAIRPLLLVYARKPLNPSSST